MTKRAATVLSTDKRRKTTHNVGAHSCEDDRPTVVLQTELVLNSGLTECDERCRGMFFTGGFPNRESLHVLFGVSIQRCDQSTTRKHGSNPTLAILSGSIIIAVLVIAAAVVFVIAAVTAVPQWGTADAEIKVPPQLRTQS